MSRGLRWASNGAQRDRRRPPPPPPPPRHLPRDLSGKRGLTHNGSVLYPTVYEPSRCPCNVSSIEREGRWRSVFLCPSADSMKRSNLANAPESPAVSHSPVSIRRRVQEHIGEPHCCTRPFITINMVTVIPF